MLLAASYAKSTLRPKAAPVKFNARFKAFSSLITLPMETTYAMKAAIATKTAVPTKAVSAEPMNAKVLTTKLPAPAVATSFALKTSSKADVPVICIPKLTIALPEPVIAPVTN